MPRRDHTSHVEAECADCPWRDDRGGAHGRAAQHHDKTRHAVIVRHTIIYNRPHDTAAVDTIGLFDQPPQEGTT